jgi:two-component system, NtrC family, response regulator HydG
MKPSSKAAVLVVDDHEEMVNVLREQLTEAGYAVDVATGGAHAIERLRRQPPDVILTDLRMQGVDGLDVLDAARELDPELPVLIMTAYGAIDTAVEAIKRGAFHYFAKPFQLDEVVLFVGRAIADRRLRSEHRALQRLATERSSFGTMVGRSAGMRSLWSLIERIAPSSAPVLVRGESGSGKELVARALHFQGPRRDRAFVAVNCTALPEALLESELFGHVRGSFTGAVSTRRGLFVEADGGTLFLDEIGDMPAPLQAKLLRAIEDGEVRSVGADASRHVDVRIVAATHQDLEERVHDGRFRADLFYRLNVVSLPVPPLRERAEDIPVLIEHFLRRARERNPDSPVMTLGPDVMALFAASPWPGNARELENVVERLVIMSGQSVVGRADVEAFAPQVLANMPPPLAAARTRIIPLRQLEDEYIAWVIAECGGSKAKAAEKLGVDPSTLYRREKDKPSR